MRAVRCLLALLASATALAPSAFGEAPGGAPAPVCDSSTPLTLVGLDTAAGEALLALPRSGWIDLRLGGTPSAVLVVGDGRELVAASQGAGPLLAIEPCGPGCLQPVRADGGAWTPAGEAIVAPPSATATATYDAGGVPWIVLHEPGGGAGVVNARAFRLQDGEWRSAGALRVTDVGVPGAHPIAAADGALASGTGRFRAGAEPDYWLTGLPDLPAARRGEVVPLGGDAAVAVAADGVVYRTSDRGATWRRAVWTPWSATVVQPWTVGRDYESEPPAGDLSLPFPIVWFDRRDPNAGERLVLSTMSAAGDWTTVATVPATIERSPGESLEIRDVIRLPGERWVLVAGCSDAGEIVLRTVAAGASAVVSVPVARGPRP